MGKAKLFLCFRLQKMQPPVIHYTSWWTHSNVVVEPGTHHLSILLPTCMLVSQPSHRIRYKPHHLDRLCHTSSLAPEQAWFHPSYNTWKAALIHNNISASTTTNCLSPTTTWKTALIHHNILASTTTNANKHVRTKHLLVKFPCELCGQFFSSTQDLTKHSSIHT